MMVICKCAGCGKNLGSSRVEVKCAHCGHVQDMVACSQIEGGALTKLKSVREDDWPWWARKIAARRNEAETGVGDTLERLLAMAGGRKIKQLAKAAKIDCGCDSRQASLNELYPYCNIRKR